MADEEDWEQEGTQLDVESEIGIGSSIDENDNATLTDIGGVDGYIEQQQDLSGFTQPADTAREDFVEQTHDTAATNEPYGGEGGQAERPAEVKNAQKLSGAGVFLTEPFREAPNSLCAGGSIAAAASHGRAAEAHAAQQLELLSPLSRVSGTGYNTLATVPVQQLIMDTVGDMVGTGGARDGNPAEHESSTFLKPGVGTIVREMQQSEDGEGLAQARHGVHAADDAPQAAAANVDLTADGSIKNTDARMFPFIDNSAAGGAGPAAPACGAAVAAADSDGEMQPTQLDSPDHACQEAAAPRQAERDTGSLDLRLSSLESPTNQLGRSGPPCTPPTDRKAVAGRHADVNYALGISELKLPSLSRSSSAAPRPPPSPPRRSGQGSGVFLARPPTPEQAPPPADFVPAPKGDNGGPSTSQLQHNPQPCAAAIPSQEGVETAASATEINSEDRAPSPPRSFSATSSFTPSTVAGPSPSAVAAFVASSGVFSAHAQGTGAPKGFGGTATSANGGGDLTPATPGKIAKSESVGFLSSAETSSKAAGAVARSFSSPQPLPGGWLDEQLTAAAVSKTNDTSAIARQTAAGVEGYEEGQTRKAIGFARDKDAAKQTVVSKSSATLVPKRPSPAKVVPGPGGWIQTKKSSSKGSGGGSGNGGGGGGYGGGGGNESAFAEDNNEQDANLSSQEGSVSQNILAIGVPQERRPRAPLPPPPLPLPQRANENGTQEGWPYRDEVEILNSQSEEEESEGDEGTSPRTAPPMNTQDILEKGDLSQMQRQLSQERKEVERLMDLALEQGQDDDSVGPSQGGEGSGLFPLSEPSPRPIGDGNAPEAVAACSPRRIRGLPEAGVPEPPPTRTEFRGGDGAVGADFGRGSGGRGAMSSKRKKMRVIVPAAAREKASPVGGVVGRGGTTSRTPGAYVARSGSSKSAKKRVEVTSPPKSRTSISAKNVFMFPSDDEEDGNDSGVKAAGATTTRANPSSVAGPTKSGRDKGKGKNTSPHREAPPALPLVGYDRSVAVEDVLSHKTKLPAAGDRSADESESEAAADVRDLVSESEEDDEEDVQGVSITQDQMARRMAAIGKNLSASSSAADVPNKSDQGQENEATDEGRGSSQAVSATRTGERSRDAASVGHAEAGVSGAKAGAGCRGSSPDTTERPASMRSKPMSSHCAADSAGPAADRSLVTVSPASGRGGEGSDGDAATVVGGAAEGGTSVGSEPLAFVDMSEFLKEEGWKCVNGKGLTTYFYIIPGGKGKPPNWVFGVDFFNTEQEVVAYVSRDAEFLTRCRAFQAALPGSSLKNLDTRGGSPADRGKCKRARGGGTSHGCRKGTRAHDTSLEKYGSRKGRSNGVGAITNVAAGNRENVRVRGRRIAKTSEQCNSPGHEEKQPKHLWMDKWLELKPDLLEQGWHWSYSKGLDHQYVWMKKGVRISSGTPGVDMFYSEKAVLAHVLGNGATWNPKDRQNDNDWEQFRMVRGVPVIEQRVEEWGLTRNRSKRRKLQPQSFPGDSPPPETNKSGDEPTRRPERSSAPRLRSTTPAGGRRSSKAPADAAADRSVGVKVAAAGQSRKRGRPSKRPRGTELAPPPKRARGGANELPPPEPCDGVGGGSRQEVEGDDDVMSDGGMEDATQPQYELASAIHMAEVGRGRTAVCYAAASVAAVATDVGGAIRGEPAGTGAATAAANPARVVSTVSTPLLKDPAGVSPLWPAAQEFSAASSGATVCSAGGLPAPQGRSDSNGAGGSNDSTAQPRESATGSPPSSRCGRDDGVGLNKRGSPSAGGSPRMSSRFQGPLSGTGVIVTGIQHSGERSLAEKQLKKLGARVFKVFSKGAVDDDAGELEKWVREARHGVGDARRPERGDDRGPVVLAVATPDSDRTQKYTLALAAGVPIVHWHYVKACSTINAKLDPTPYMLPYGRSALGEHGLIMPERLTSSSRERPFQGKRILLFLGDAKDQPSVERWALILRMGGAKATTLGDSGNVRSSGDGGGEARKADRWAAAAEGGHDRRCNIKTALALLRKGEFHYLIGPEVNGISDRAIETREKLRATALRAGVTSGTLEWAAQCIMHGRPLVSSAGTCSWFPLEAAIDRGCGSGSGAVDGAAEGAPPSKVSGKGKKGKGRAGGSGDGRGRSAANGGGARNAGHGGKKGIFHVHSAGGRRFVAGDYAFLKEPTGVATSDKGAPAASAGRGHKTAGAARNTTGGGGGAGVGGRSAGGDGAIAGAGTSRPRVARVLAFELGPHNEVEALVTVMEPHVGSSKLLVAGREKRVRHEALGARVLVMEKEEMNASQIYSIADAGVFCLAEERKGAGRVSG